MDIDHFETYRSLLHGIAYRMLGSIAEAEDIIQETYLKWADQDHAKIQSTRSWLVTVCSRLSLDRLKSAQYQRETYIGPWLPEPLLVTEESPAKQLDVDDSVTTALLYTLERLTPSERASFLLHDIFGYSYKEVSEILKKSAPTCRKLASRGRAQAKEDKPRFETNPDKHQNLLHAFFGAAKDGNLTQLETMLAQDVTLISDGGGKAFAARKIMHGSAIISTFFININKQAANSGNDYQYRTIWYNGSPGLVLYENGTPVTAINIEISNDQITAFYIHRNPDKLQAFNNK